jgi:putative NADH-flavin reductase
MKMAIIGAGGNLGRILSALALKRGHEVTGYVIGDVETPAGLHTVSKSLFDLDRSDLQGCEAVISCFGSGFDCDPSVNRKACDKLIELTQGSGIHVLHIIGSGSLYETEKHESRVYEAPDHPDFLRGISAEALKGMEDFKASRNVCWTVVCPSKNFDRDAEPVGKYRVGTDENLLYNSKGVSYVTYGDLAAAMLDFAEKGEHIGQICTILSDI